jgi:hypothetical protein
MFSRDEGSKILFLIVKLEQTASTIEQHILDICAEKQQS